MDIVKTKTLGKLFMKLETRSGDGSRRKIVLLFISYLLPGIFLPLLLFRQTMEPSGFEFTFLTYLFSSLILAFTVINEFDNLVVSKTEAELITSMPLDDELIVNAKMFVILRYVFYISLPLFIPGSLFYYLALRSEVRSLLYFISGYMLCLFMVCILLLLYCIALRNLKPQSTGTYTLILQIILIFFIIIGYQFVSYAFTNRTSTGITSYFDTMKRRYYVLLFPQSWFGYIPIYKNADLDYNLLLRVFLPVFICYMSYLTLKIYLTENYKIIREKFSYSRLMYGGEQGRLIRDNTPAGAISRFIGNLYLRDHTEQASFKLLQSSFKRDKAVRMNILPLIAIPVGLAVFALLTKQLPSAIDMDFFGARPVFLVSIFLAVLMVLNTSVLGIRVTNNAEASWIYDAYPMDSIKHFMNGIRKFFVVYLLAPVCIMLFILFALKMPLLQALMNTMFILVSALLFNSVYHVFNKTLPFTKENTIYNSLQRIASMVFPLIFGGVFIFLISYIYRDTLAVWLVILGLFVINYWVVFFGFMRTRSGFLS